MPEPTLPESPTVLHPATERCDFCEQAYVYELEFRCYDCDRPICPFCVVTVRARGRAHCPECPPEEA